MDSTNPGKPGKIPDSGPAGLHPGYSMRQVIT